MSTFIVIEPKHVGQMLIEGWGRQWRTSDFLGRVMWQDVGKRVYRVATPVGESILQVENQEQFYRRLLKEKPNLATYCVKYEVDLSDALGRVTMTHYVLVDAVSESTAFNAVQMMAKERCMQLISLSVVDYLTLQEAKQEYIYNKGKSGLREVF